MRNGRAKDEIGSLRYEIKGGGGEDEKPERLEKHIQIRCKYLRDM